MSSDSSDSPEKDSRDRFRRLLSSSEGGEEETLPPVSQDGEKSQEEITPRYVSLAPQVRGDLGDTSPNKPSAPAVPPTPDQTPATAPPAFENEDMPLPKRVDEVDMGATRVTPAAYTPPIRHRAIERSHSPEPPRFTARTRSAAAAYPPAAFPRPVSPASQAVPARRINWRRSRSCLLISGIPHFSLSIFD